MKKALFYLAIASLAIISLVVAACSSSGTDEPDQQGITEEESQQIAQQYVQESATFAFDGIEDTLKLTETLYPDFEYSWQFVFQFDSRNAGYGDRTGQALAQVITPHEAIITVENEEVKSAVLDNQWDMMNQQMLDGNGDNPLLTPVSKQESQQIALDYLLNSPTYLFDGIDGSVELVETLTARCPYCWVFRYEFESSHAGYGDRTGQMLAQVITAHTASIGVEQGKITVATMDTKWNMLAQELISQGSSDEPGLLSVAELMADPQYETTVTIEGKVSLLGELFCPCFELNSGGETVQVWYGLMVADDGTEMPSLSVEGIENGDWVTVTGKLKQAGQHSALNDFWAESITVSDQPVIVEDIDHDDQLVGGTPGSCGYTWDAERHGWHRTWDAESFIPADQKPEWEQYIPSSQIVSAVLLDRSNSGEEMDLAISDSVSVVLDSNPSTGFSWQLIDISNENVLKNTNKEFRLPEIDPPPGTPGEEVWTFEAIGAGTSTLSLEYSRPWEGGEKAVETFVLNVTVE